MMVNIVIYSFILSKLHQPGCVCGTIPGSVSARKCVQDHYMQGGKEINASDRFVQSSHFLKGDLINRKMK